MNDVYEFEFLTDIVPFTMQYKDALAKHETFEKVQEQKREIDAALGL